MLTAADSPHVPPQSWRTSAPGNASWSPWSPAVASTRRSPPSCSSACARSARSQPEPRLCGHRQRLPASHQDPQIIAARQQPCAQPGNSLNDMLTVIQHRQRPSTSAGGTPDCSRTFSAAGSPPPGPAPGPEQVPARPATPRQRTRPATARATRPTSRVLPAPARPVTVTSRYRPSSPPLRGPAPPGRQSWSARPGSHARHGTPRTPPRTYHNRQNETRNSPAETSLRRRHFVIITSPRTRRRSRRRRPARLALARAAGLGRDCRHRLTSVISGCVHSCCTPRGPASITETTHVPNVGKTLPELRDLASGVAEGPPDASRQDCNTLHTYEALRCF